MMPWRRAFCSKPLYRAGAAVAAGEAHAMLAGAANPTARVIEAALMTIGPAEGIATPSSFFLMQWPDRRLVFADCGVNIQPTAAELADIAIASAQVPRASSARSRAWRCCPFRPRAAAAIPMPTRWWRRCASRGKRRPHLKIDGELQGDAALSPAVAAKKMKEPGEVAGRANVLVFPDLDAGNIAYKLTQYLSGAQAMGPVLQGFAQARVGPLARRHGR